MQKIILFCLLTLILSYDGGYIHWSFEEKHILVSTSLEIGKKAVANIIKSAFENSTSYKIYPLEIFSQKVSGINFKVVFAGITETKKPSIFTVTIYYPDENSRENLQFKGIVTANEAINKNDSNWISWIIFRRKLFWRCWTFCCGMLLWYFIWKFFG